MKTQKILLALSAVLFLFIIPIALFSAYLYDSQPLYTHELLFQRDFSQYAAYAYNRSEETCNYLEGQSPTKTISCTRKFLTFTIYAAEKSENKYRYFLKFSNSLIYMNVTNEYSGYIANQTYDDILSFYLDEDFHFDSLIYSNLTNKTLVDLARSIIYQFSPNLFSENYNKSSFAFESIGDMKGYVQRKISDYGDHYVLYQEVHQDQSTGFNGNNTYTETVSVDKTSGIVNETVTTQTMYMPLNYDIESNVSSLTMAMKVITTTSTQLQKTTADQNQVSQIKYNFLQKRDKILEYSLFSTSPNVIANSTQTSNRLLENITEETPEKFTCGQMEMFGIKFELFLEIEKAGKTITVTPVLNAINPNNASATIEFRLYPYKFLKEGIKSSTSSFNQLMKTFYGTTLLNESIKSNNFEIIEKMYKMPKIPIAAVPVNPLMITGSIFLELSVEPVIIYMLERINFFYLLENETDFTQSKYNKTKFYNKNLTNDIEEIKTLINGSKADIFTESYPLRNAVEMKLVFKAAVGLEMDTSKDMSTISVETTVKGELFKGNLKLSFDVDFYEKSSYLAVSLNLTFGALKFQIFLIMGASKLTLYEKKIEEDPSKKIEVPLTNLTVNMIDYEDETDSNSTALPIPTECILNDTIESDVKCFSKSPCGCSLYPYIYNETNETSYIASKKGISDACETEEPLINQEYFDFYRIKVNCQTPYQEIDQTTCKPKSDWFYIGEGYRLTKDMKNNSNFSELMDIPDAFFEGGNIETANKAKNLIIPNTILKYYNNLLFQAKLIYQEYYNNKTYYQDIMNRTDDFKNLSRSIRTAFFLFMDNFEAKDGSNDEVLMSLLRDFYLQNWQNIIDRCALTDNYLFCEENNLLPIITLLKYSCNKCNYTESTMNAQMIFIMDGSGSISDNDFITEKNFVAKLLNTLSQNAKFFYQAAAIQFSSSAIIVSNFTNFTENFTGAVNKTKKLDAYTETGRAFKLASDLFAKNTEFNGMRFVFIITDGQATDNYTTGLQELRNTSTFSMIAIGVGKNMNLSELYDYTQSIDNVYMISNFNSLMFMEDMIGQEMCYGIEEVKDEDFAQNKTIVGNSQLFYRLKYTWNNGKTIMFSKIEGELDIYASESNAYPNEHVHDYKAMLINGSYYLMIPKKSNQNKRILEGATDSNSSSFYLSMSYNTTTSANLEIITYNNITINLPCFANCLTCDETGQLCFECTSDFALISNKCKDLKLAEELFYSSNSHVVYAQNGTEDVVNEGNLAGLIIFCLLEFGISITLVLIGMKFLKEKKNPQNKNCNVKKENQLQNTLSPTEIPLKILTDAEQNQV